MKVFICAKKGLSKQNPAVEIVFLAGSTLIVIFSNLTVAHTALTNHGIGCSAAAYISIALYILYKQMLCIHLVQRIHTIRACHHCTRGASLLDKYSHRWRDDWVWRGLMVFLTANNIALLIHSLLSTQHHFSLGKDGAQCLIGYNNSGSIHLFVAVGVTGCCLINAFLWIVACTTVHYPDLREIPQWQYRSRQILSKCIPNYLKLWSNRPGTSCGPDVTGFIGGTECPAYLCNLNGDTAGKAEQAAWHAFLASNMVYFPSMVNAILLWRVAAMEKPLYFLLASTIEGRFHQSFAKFPSKYLFVSGASRSPRLHNLRL
jgi:hypothetical protein